MLSESYWYGIPGQDVLKCVVGVINPVQIKQLNTVKVVCNTTEI